MTSGYMWLLLIIIIILILILLGIVPLTPRISENMTTIPPAETSEIPDTVRYGDTVVIRNLEFSNNYLTACGNANNSCQQNVTLQSFDEFEDLMEQEEDNSNVWTIQGGPIGSVVNSGTNIILLHSSGGFLTPCGQTLNCGINIGLRPFVSEDLQNWRVMGGPSGSELLYNTAVQFISNASENNYLRVCGNKPNCGHNVVASPLATENNWIIEKINQV